MFDRIAPRYDLMNRLMSLAASTGGGDASPPQPRTSRSAHAPSTCAPAPATSRSSWPIGSVPRRRHRRRLLGGDAWSAPTAKAAANGAPATFQAADALALPFDDDAFDGATVAFGARNLSDLDRGLAEMARVVRPGGRVVVLEITTPRRLRALHGLWFDRVVPRLGGLIGGDRAAYRYLPASAKRFPSPPELATLMTKAGLVDVSWRGFMGGIVALHQGRVA